MKRRVSSNLVLYTVAGISATLAVLLSYAYLEKRLAEQRRSLESEVIRVVEEPDLHTVVVAGRDVYRGRRLDAEDLKVLKVPVEGILLDGVITKPDDAIGRIALGPLYAGEWLVDRKLASPDDPREGLDNLLAEGHRAVRIPVTRVSGLLGILEPGDRVDLIGVFPGETGKQTISRTLLQNVPVLAVGRHGLPGTAAPGESGSGPVDEKESTVTLDVTRQGAEIIALALEIGRIQLALRNKADLISEGSPGVNIRQLQSVTAVQEAPAPAPRRQKTIEVLHGERIERQAIPR